ncbi:MAG: L-histidine N(alpha)-methyltransferase [Acidiferrobacteraceae bacterium]
MIKQARTTGNAAKRIVLHPLPTDRPGRTMAEEVVRGLSASPKHLPCKYFYDHTGSLLFEQICRTDEYYPWRAEDALLAEIATALIDCTAPRTIIELGSGSSRKTRRLLDACATTGRYPDYMPLDVCPQMLTASAEDLTGEYPWLNVTALAGDYTLGFSRLSSHASPALFLFLGGTIGNFPDHEIGAFLSGLRAVMHPGDFLLLGADLEKDERVLRAAYNDAAGLTEAFNINILNVINRELDGDFSTNGFVHDAKYNHAQSRVEMHLVSKWAQSARLGRCGATFSFSAGEPVLTEISRKFSPSRLRDLLSAARFSVDTLHTAPDPSFALLLAMPRLSD